MSADLQRKRTPFAFQIDRLPARLALRPRLHDLCKGILLSLSPRVGVFSAPTAACCPPPCSYLGPFSTLPRLGCTRRGTKVIEARGKSSALSAANAIVNQLRDWLSPLEGGNEGEEDQYNDTGGEDVNEDGAGGERVNPFEISEDLTDGYRSRAKEDQHAGTPRLDSGRVSGDLRGRGELMRQRRKREGQDQEEGQEWTTAGAAVSMGVFSNGNPYGVPDDLVFSFPVKSGEGDTSGWGSCLSWSGKGEEGGREAFRTILPIDALVWSWALTASTNSE